jgi:hypothetical protein
MASPELVQLVKLRLLSGWAVATGAKPCIDVVALENRARVEYIKAGHTAVGFIEKTESLRRRLELDAEAFKRLVLVFASHSTAIGGCLVEALVFEGELEKSVELLAEFIKNLARSPSRVALYPKNLS